AAGMCSTRSAGGSSIGRSSASATSASAAPERLPSSTALRACWRMRATNRRSCGGYGRKSPSSRPTVVSDGRQVVPTLDTAGDEPLMLARSLVSKGVSVVVGADRYACGRVAESQLNATVHILDDGFQHFALARDVDLVVTGEHDLSDEPLPHGRLREPLSSAASADAVLVDAGYQDAAERIGRALRVRNAYHITRSLLPPRMVDSGDTVVVPNESRVFAFAGIARPERFFADLTSAGWDVVGT